MSPRCAPPNETAAAASRAERNSLRNAARVHTALVERGVALQVVKDADHYDVTRAMREARVSLWVATANVKDIHLEAPIGTRARARGRYESILEVFDGLVGRGVELRLLHA